jgi:hypothetical protein
MSLNDNECSDTVETKSIGIKHVRELEQQEEVHRLHDFLKSKHEPCLEYLDIRHSSLEINCKQVTSTFVS